MLFFILKQGSLLGGLGRGGNFPQTFLFLCFCFLFSFCLFSRQLSETRCCFHWRPHSLHSCSAGFIVAMEKKKKKWGTQQFNGGAESGGSEGRKRFPGPILSNHQTLLMWETGKEARVRNRKTRNTMKRREETTSK